jgi:hypothetical protein
MKVIRQQDPGIDRERMFRADRDHRGHRGAQSRPHRFVAENRPAPIGGHGKEVGSVGNVGAAIARHTPSVAQKAYGGHRAGTPVPTKIIRHKKPPNPDELGGFADVIGVIRYVRMDTKSACPPYQADGESTLRLYLLQFKVGNFR